MADHNPDVAKRWSVAFLYWAFRVTTIPWLHFAASALCFGMAVYAHRHHGIGTLALLWASAQLVVTGMISVIVRREITKG
jgi:hypothetical protein